MKKKFIIICFMVASLFSNCQYPIRKPIVQGTFYPASATELKKEIESWYKAYQPTKYITPIRAIIVPHAGYVYSGAIAARAYAQIEPGAKYKNVFLIGRSHQGYFSGASLYTSGAFANALGEVEVNDDICKKLLQHKIFDHPSYYHDNEHSLEVQLPFLQLRLAPDFKIVPILIGTENTIILDEIATILKQYYEPENLFVISTDLSHYPSYKDAIISDSLTVEAILSGDPKKFQTTVNYIETSGKYPNLSTAACGAAAVYVLLKIIENEPCAIKKIYTANSGDISGDHSRVVGYASLIVVPSDKNTNIQTKSTDTEFTLTDEEKKFLKDLAFKSIKYGLTYHSFPKVDIPDWPGLHTNCGVFVTINKRGKLRGCIGTFRQDRPLWQNVMEMAQSAAFSDPRFPPLSFDELNEIDIEISVLTPLKKINSIDEIQLGKHGIYIKKGMNSGTFLPQVATDTGWTLEEFLGHCARDKAGIGYYGWKDPDAEIYIYEAIVF
ncbi:MAG: AmmeMemoRadiSam system protein B [Bacteroidales bacterium]|jgi:AmmeMemoRadiSam system protein B/AmmeMemoRadiSam system protein A|nr:AmmeMemoRadiSam system protein B [Bacteroidales bacterium]MDY0401559.1 AmmeMemoRadiSam system protein B [Bacteroidales bacterium]HOB78413.1 AmmeMemoRadiSam system protein B [Bacteroidales bacterium]HPZ61804.1 AmmeMemoRadiSam system protein B [Bacteroidales bacterium]HQD59528.1 AmmeMemoRadiSam system protein B [Bacteroidales bacterium]